VVEAYRKYYNVLNYYNFSIPAKVLLQTLIFNVYLVEAGSCGIEIDERENIQLEFAVSTNADSPLDNLKWLVIGSVNQ
jgi:hypothetical protein